MDVFEQPKGVLIAPTAKNGMPGTTTLYGGTSSAANWVLAQWDIPDELPPFQNNFTQNEFASARFFPGVGFALQQDGTKLPCEKIFPSGKKLVDEFDLFVSPATHIYPAFPQAFKNDTLPLSKLNHIFLEANLKPTSLTLVDLTCQISWATASVGIVLSNRTIHQTFFYQINFNLYQADGQSMSLSLRKPDWFSKGISSQTGNRQNFGYGDRVWADAYNMPPAVIGNVSVFDLNLLPRIEELIAQGNSFGMDQNLSDWAITGAYFGQSVFGHIQFSSEWSGLALKIN